MTTRPVPLQEGQDELAAADQAHVLHPMAPADNPDPLIFVEGSGPWLTDARGDVYLDANCGLMNNHIGYGRRELAEVAGESMLRLSYAKLFWGHASPPPIRLARKLAEITPGSISRFFFTASGSEANESAIKLIRYRNAVNGQPEKTKFIARMHSYHGMTLGAWSVTGEPAFWPNFGPRVPGFVHIEQPAPGDGDPAAALVQAIEREGPETVAAFLAEPISLPAKVNVPPPDYWPRVREVCDAYDVLLVADEVVTGFGRTGRWFACEHWGIVPDLIVLSKGITSGYIPLGAVGMTTAFAEGFHVTDGAMLHGFTAGGHPVACDVALRAIQIIEDEGLVENAATLGEQLRLGLEELEAATGQVANVRGLGLLTGVDLVVGEGAGADMIEELKRGGTIMRNYGDTMLLGLPLTAGSDDVDELVRRFAAALTATVSRRSASAS